MSSPFLQFSTNDDVNDTPLKKGCWKILIVDDESIMHSVTELVLRDFKFEDRGLDFYSAYSMEDAQKVLQEHTDIAVALIDIVMEDDNSGLQLIRWIREEQKNKEVRIILRTGQPGLAPERDIIQRYEINDYKEKTELTDVKLITALTVAIRGFRDLHVLNRNRVGFARILQGGGKLWSSNTTLDFLGAIDGQYRTIAAGESLEDVKDSLIVQKGAGGYKTRYSAGMDLDLKHDDLDRLSDLCSKEKQIVYEEPFLVCSLHTRQAEGLFLIARVSKEPDETDHNILSAFLMNASLAMDYWFLTVNRSRSQKKMLYFLSEVIEQHFSETGNHIRRVSEMVYVMSVKLGIPEDQAENWRMASILHDLGKIGIPDHILKKPGKLTDAEMEIMKSHVQIGYKMLSSNEDEFFPDAADMALSHHECWDGSGYPSGMKGEEIPLPARILAVVDVFDALTHQRVYKSSWNLEDALQFLKERKGKDFEPSLVDLFFANLNDMKDILNDYPD